MIEPVKQDPNQPNLDPAGMVSAVPNKEAGPISVNTAPSSELRPVSEFVTPSPELQRPEISSEVAKIGVGPGNDSIKLSQPAQAAGVRSSTVQSISELGNLDLARIKKIAEGDPTIGATNIARLEVKKEEREEFNLKKAA